MVRKVKILRNFLRLGISYPKVAIVVMKVWIERLSYLDINALIDLVEVVKWIENHNIPGVYVEAGCALGGSSLVIAASKNASRPFLVYDAFETIPAPSENDGIDVHERYKQIVSGNAQGVRGDAYYGYLSDLYTKVIQNFARFRMPVEEINVRLIKGLFQETLSDFNQQVALAHLDCDWYDSTMTCLKRIEPNLSPNGILVIDDYLHWSGCRKAVEDYFSGKWEMYKFEFKARLHIQKLA